MIYCPTKFLEIDTGNSGWVESPSQSRILIWKDRTFSKWLLSRLDQKSFQQRIFKALNNHKHSGYVDYQQVRWMDRNLFFFILKLLIFRRWWQLWMKSTTIWQRYRMNLFFVVFQLFILLPDSISKFIHVRWHKFHFLKEKLT